MSEINVNNRLRHIIDLLEFSLSIDDKEIIKATVEAVLEMLQETINDKY